VAQNRRNAPRNCAGESTRRSGVTENAEKLAAFERGLAALKDNTVQVSDNDAYVGASVILTFSGGAAVRVDYWRLLKNSLAVVSSFDHQQKYGMPQPVDARRDLRKALDGQQVVEVRLDKQTGDLLFAFSGRAHLQAFNLTGYEVWDAAFPDGNRGYSNFVMTYLYEAAAAR
jgi:hypothetical protein